MVKLYQITFPHYSGINGCKTISLAAERHVYHWINILENHNIPTYISTINVEYREWKEIFDKGVRGNELYDFLK